MALYEWSAEHLEQSARVQRPRLAVVGPR
jgi:hypothetical protein